MAGSSLGTVISLRDRENREYLARIRGDGSLRAQKDIYIYSSGTGDSSSGGGIGELSEGQQQLAANTANAWQQAENELNQYIEGLLELVNDLQKDAYEKEKTIASGSNNKIDPGEMRAAAPSINEQALSGGSLGRVKNNVDALRDYNKMNQSPDPTQMYSTKTSAPAINDEAEQRREAAQQLINHNLVSSGRADTNNLRLNVLKAQAGSYGVMISLNSQVASQTKNGVTKELVGGDQVGVLLTGKSGASGGKDGKSGKNLDMSITPDAGKLIGGPDDDKKPGAGENRNSVPDSMFVSFSGLPPLEGYGPSTNVPDPDSVLFIPDNSGDTQNVPDPEQTNFIDRQQDEINADPKLPGAGGSLSGSRISIISVSNASQLSIKGLGEGGAGQLPSFDLSRFEPSGYEDGVMVLNYTQLIPGDLVYTPSFNGLFAGSVAVTGNDSYEADRNALKNAVLTGLYAYENDHPEVFWLGESMKLKAVTVQIGESVSDYLFLIFSDSEGYAMMLPEYFDSDALAAAIAERDRAAEAVIEQIPDNSTIPAALSVIHRALVLGNDYNSSEDLSTIGPMSHRSLSALLGSTGEKGPVCDGYAKAFKLICDMLGIPCQIQTGILRLNGAESFHSWNTVRLADGSWYAVDVSLDDPAAGQESERYFLTGENSVIGGLWFSETHIPSSVTAGGEEVFENIALAKDDPASLPQFRDIPLNAWYYGDVKAAKGRGLMEGTGSGSFSPELKTTRGQVIAVLYRLSGEEFEGDENPFSDVPDSAYYARAAAWAKAKGISDGKGEGRFAPEDKITREELLTFLYRYAVYKGLTDSAASTAGDAAAVGVDAASAADAAYATAVGVDAAASAEAFTDMELVSGYARDAVNWAKACGILNGKTGSRVAPADLLSRAELAAFINRMAE